MNTILSLLIGLTLCSNQAQVSAFRFDSDEYTGAAGPHDPFSSYAPSQPICALRRAIGADGDYFIKRALLENKPKLAARISAITLWGLSTTMTLAEQKWFQEKVWHLSDCEVTPDFANVFRSPTLVSELKAIGDPLGFEIYSLGKAGRIRRAERFGDGPADLEFYDAIAAVSSALVTEPRTLIGATAVKARLIRDDLARDLSQIRERLPSNAQQEWDAVLKQFRNKCRLAEGATDPWIDGAGVGRN